jgi:hypothetical protein
MTVRELIAALLDRDNFLSLDAIVDVAIGGDDGPDRRVTGIAGVVSANAAAARRLGGHPGGWVTLEIEPEP